jgi:hypothetical protein
MGVLQGFDSVFGCEPPHEQCKIGIDCNADGGGINSLNIFGGAAASVHFYNKFDGLISYILRAKREQAAVHVFEVEYTTESGLPHSQQRGCNREVINPQTGTSFVIETQLVEV